MGTRKYYRADKNPETAMLPGVPLRDLTDEEYEALPKWLQRSVDESPLYQATNPAPTPRRERKADEEVT